MAFKSSIMVIVSLKCSINESRKAKCLNKSKVLEKGCIINKNSVSKIWHDTLEHH